MENSCSPGCRWWCLWWRLFVLSFFPTRCLGWDLGLHWVSSEGFPTYSFYLLLISIFFYIGRNFKSSKESGWEARKQKPTSFGTNWSNTQFFRKIILIAISINLWKEQYFVISVTLWNFVKFAITVWSECMRNQLNVGDWLSCCKTVILLTYLMHQVALWRLWNV